MDKKEDSLDITPEQKKEIDDLFNNKELAKYMSSYARDPAHAVEDDVSSEVKLKRMEDALDAFSKLPPDWWDFSK